MVVAKGIVQWNFFLTTDSSLHKFISLYCSRSSTATKGNRCATDVRLRILKRVNRCFTPGGVM